MSLILGTNNGDLLFGNGEIDLILGFGGNDTLYGLDNNDELVGDAGDDMLNGGAGADRLDGGSGIDTAFYSGSSGGVSVDLQQGIGTAGDALGDQYVDIENVSGTRFDDLLIGNGLGNVLVGSSGNDILIGNEGADTLDGGTGIDHLDGGNGIDTVVYSSEAHGIGVNLGLNSGGDGDTLASIENAIGSNFGDFLFGSSGDNRLEGLDGEDWLNGLIGNDVLIGGEANDVLFGGEGRDLLMAGGGLNYLNGEGGIDTISYTDFSSGIVLTLIGGDVFVNGAPKDSMVDIENATGTAFSDSLTGDNGNNVLKGLNGNDVIFGLDGADILVGGAGADLMTGGSGADSFDFDRIAESRSGAMDRIDDFSSIDIIDLSTIDAKTGTPGSEAFSFIGSTNFTGVAGQLRFVAANGDTLVLGDVNGDGKADLQFVMTGQFTLTAGDFIL